MLAALGALVVGAGMASAAVQAPDGSLKGCVKSGAIRIVDQSEKCKDTELAITLLTGADNAITSAMVKDGALTADDIAPRTITGAQVATGTLEGGDDAATANQIKDGTVTAFDLAGGSVGEDELQAGAVGPDKQRANAQTGLTGGLGTVVEVTGRDPAEADLAAVSLTPAGDGTADHLVLLTGQFEAAWEYGSDPVIVEWQIMDGTREVGPVYRIVLDPGQVTTGSVSFVDAGATEGVARTYSLRVTVDHGGSFSTERVRFLNAALTAVDLGRR